MFGATVGGLEIMRDTKDKIKREAKPYRDQFKQACVASKIPEAQNMVKGYRKHLTPKDFQQCIALAKKNKQENFAKYLEHEQKQMPEIKRENKVTKFFLGQWQKWAPARFQSAPADATPAVPAATPKDNGKTKK